MPESISTGTIAPYESGGYVFNVRAPSGAPPSFSSVYYKYPPAFARILRVYILPENRVRIRTLSCLLISFHVAAQVAESQARYTSPRWSPDGRRLMFGANLENTRRLDLFAINADGSALVKIREDARDGSWSSDGKRVLFAAMTAGNLDVYVMNADGSNVQQLTRTPDMEYQPTWSPDGKQIAFLNIPAGEGQHHDVHLMNADGTNRIPLTETAAFEESFVVWSPDSKKIAFASNRDGNLEVYALTLASKDLRRLTNDAGSDNVPAFTPDSRSVVFISGRGGARQFWRVSAEGGEAALVGPAVASPVAWSNDHRMLAYLGASDASSGIFVVSPASNSEPRRVTPIPVAPNKLAQLRWLAGCWERRTPALKGIEMWMYPEGELMLGASRTISGGVTSEYEQLRLEARGDTLVYTALPVRQKETEFRTMQISDTGFVVENLAHNFPQRIIYRRRGADSLVARIEGPGPNNTTRGIDFPMRRVGCSP